MKVVATLALLLLTLTAAHVLAPPANAQTPVTVTGPITVGDCAQFASVTIIKDAGVTCGGGGGGGGIVVGTTTVTGGGVTNGQYLFNNAGVVGAATLGTMATQNANAVAITGGTITGLGLPSVSSDAANKQYVDNSITGLIIHGQVLLATTAALPANTYNNGTAGVGATLTGNSNGALTVDTILTTTSARILVKNETSTCGGGGSPGCSNGIYVVTTVGNGGTPYVLTRATDADVAGISDPMKIGFGTYVFVTSGSAAPGNIDTGWSVNSTVTTIGTSAINWAQFSVSGSLPAAAVPGTILYYNGTAWVIFAGNTSGTLCLGENSSGVPSWLTCAGGSGSVNSVSNSDGTLTISPTFGTVVASFNTTTHSNNWIPAQQFSGPVDILNTLSVGASAPAAGIQLDVNGALRGYTSAFDAGAFLGSQISGYGTVQAVNNANSLVKPLLLQPFGGNVFTGTTSNLYIGGGSPWVDVKSGANGCAAAIGNGTTDDYAAINCQIGYMTSAFAGGVVLLPCSNGGYKTLTTLVVSVPIIFQGGGVACSAITTGNTDITAVKFYNASTQQHWGGLHDLQIIGSNSTSASAPLVEVDNFVNLTFSDFQIMGGGYGLLLCGSNGTFGTCVGADTFGGGDNTFRNGFISGAATGGAGIYSYNASDWFYDMKVDNVGSPLQYAVVLQTDSGISGVTENDFFRVDMSGNFSGGSLFLNDATSARSTVVMFHPIFGASGGFGSLGTFRHLSLTGCECGTGTVTISSGDLTVNSSMAGNGGGGALAFTGGGNHRCGMVSGTSITNVGITC